MISGDWHDWWPVIHQAVLLNVQDPMKHPLPRGFWGYHRGIGKQYPRDPFHQAVLNLGTNPRRCDVERVIGYGNANADAWLARRYANIKGIKPAKH